jgi:chromosomal replication initiator protein
MATDTINCWEQILVVLEHKVGSQNFAIWLRPTSFSHQDNGTLFVSVPNATCKDWINEHYTDEIGEAISGLHLPVSRIEFVTGSPAAPVPAPVPAARAAEAPGPRASQDSGIAGSKLNDRYTFDNFVVATSNQLAHAAARSVAVDPAGSYNPLFLYGGVGLGKTHLTQAIGHEMRRRYPQLRICYVSAEHFMNEMIVSMQDNRMASFREWIRNVDALLVDDVQILAGKERTQEEFFHTFNTLYEARKQIVLSSDCPPKAITIEERLRSRFEWGLIADIQPPDLETRQAILLKKAETEGFHLPEDVAEFIASHVKSNVRELEGCLIRLMAYCSLRHDDVVSKEIAQEALRSLIEGNQKTVTIELIQKVVADHFKLKVHELKAKSNSKRVVFPRQIAMWMSRELTRASLPEIARAFGDKHHTTVLHSVEKIARLRKGDRDFHREIGQLMSSFQ